MPSILIPQRGRMAPRYLQRGVPFGRKNWDNPIKYKLNRSYGTEFEERTFTELQRRFIMRSAVAADFGFPGGSLVEWFPSTQGSALMVPIPSGDFEAVIEVEGGNISGTFQQMFGLGMLDASGNGKGFSPYNDGLAYNWNITGWAYASTGSSFGHGLSNDNRHVWVCINRTGSNFKGRVSNDGATWSGYTAAVALGVTPVWLTISRFWTNTPAGERMHRLNVYFPTHPG